MDKQVLDLIHQMDPPTDKAPQPLFILVQGPKVFGVSTIPMRLPFYDLELSQPWKIALGMVNEFGRPEIVSTVAKAFPKANTTCRRISSPVDCENRLVGQTGTITGLICNRMGILFRNGCYGDILNPPPTITVYDCDSGAKK